MPKKKKWSKAIVIEHILRRHRGKKKLNSNHVQLKCQTLYLAGCKYHGSWRSSIEAAGLNYDEVRVTQRAHPVWSKEKIIKILRNRRKSGLPLNSNHVQTKLPNLYTAAVNYFGSWASAIAAAGLDYSKLRVKDPMRSWSKEKIVNAVIERSEKGLSIRGNDVYQEDRGLYHAAKRYFGNNGWAKARVLAGFEPMDPRPWKIWDENTVCEEIIRLHTNNISLNVASIMDVHPRLLSGAMKVYGNWGRAIRSAGLNYSRIKKTRLGWWTKPRILLCIKSLERRGIRLSHKSIQKSHAALISAAISRFGCWSQAVEAAGISYRAHCRVWSTKAWLRRMEKTEYRKLLEKAENNARKRRKTK